ncbi:MAG: DNA-binding response regulator [Rhodospirillales bacterium CG15_BIG_FIL_POST_REV_8_21_14_020_66_15]|nr:MAG: DNA-binding response regulator [Rhodospirillales bacterium CG15_BIG_FIL_POST_REV_8_21_14_020_66_15]
MTNDLRVLIVDDDVDFAEMLSEQLKRHERLDTELCFTGEDALGAVRRSRYGVIILDVGLPDMDGREVCRLMRRENVTSQIIMLTGASSDADTILGLDAGANDYVTKPFRLEVLLARLRVQFRQHERTDGATLRIGPFHFNPSSRVMIRDDTGDKIYLTDKETMILKVLYHARGKVISRSHLMKSIWGYSSASRSHTLETHIYRLRQKFEANSKSPRYLVTHGGGYMLDL